MFCWRDGCAWCGLAGDVQESLDSAAKAGAAQAAAMADADALRKQLATLQQQVDVERRQWREQESQHAKLQEQVKDSCPLLLHYTHIALMGTGWAINVPLYRGCRQGIVYQQPWVTTLKDCATSVPMVDNLQLCTASQVTSMCSVCSLPPPSCSTSLGQLRQRQSLVLSSLHRSIRPSWTGCPPSMLHVFSSCRTRLLLMQLGELMWRQNSRWGCLSCHVGTPAGAIGGCTMYPIHHIGRTA